MTWYYAIDDQKHGPVSDADLLNLSREGAVLANTLVWREGQADWLPFRAIGPQIHGPGVETAVCADSGRLLPVSEMVPYGETHVAADRKDAFLQRLMETGDTEVSESGLALNYVGFWWRVLEMIIDGLVMMVPAAICFGPAIAAIAVAESKGEGSEPPALAIVLYIIGYPLMFAAMGFYHSWSVKKYQGTLGHHAIGAKVVNADGTRVGTGKAIGRWACKQLLNGVIAWIVMMVIFAIVFGLFFAISMAGNEGDDTPGTGIIMALPFMMLIGYPLGILLGSFPFLMAAWDKEKRALHDRICGTRVVKK